VSDTVKEEVLKPKGNRQFSTVFLYALLWLFSLLAFPAIVPQVVGFWLLLFFIQTLQAKPSTLPLVTALSILCLKGSFFEPVSIGLAFSISAGLAVHLLVFVLDRGQTIRTGFGAILVCLAVALMIRHQLSGSCSYKISSEEPGPVVCLGDSLTAGRYPKELQKICSHEVVDLGTDGIETKDGLAKLSEIFRLRPSVVVIELGGHDYNNGKTRKETFENLQKLILQLKSREIEVILVEVPRGIIYDPFRSIERELAHKHDLELISDSVIRTFIFLGPIAPPGFILPPSFRRSDDGLHPNRNGNQVFAQTVKDTIDSIIE